MHISRGAYWSLVAAYAIIGSFYLRILGLGIVYLPSLIALVILGIRSYKGPGKPVPTASSQLLNGVVYGLAAAAVLYFIYLALVFSQMGTSYQ